MFKADHIEQALKHLAFSKKTELDPSSALGGVIATLLDDMLDPKVDRSQWGKQKVSDVLQDAEVLDKLTKQGYSIRANSTVTQAVNEMLAAVGIKKAIDATGSVVEVSEFVNSSYQTTPDGAPITDNGRGPLQRDHGAGINFSKYPQRGQPPAGHSSWVSAVTNGRDGRGPVFTQQYSRPVNDEGIKPSDIAAQKQAQQQQFTEQMQQQRDAAAREARFAAMMQDRENTARDAKSWQAHVFQQQAGMVIG